MSLNLYHTIFATRDIFLECNEYIVQFIYYLVQLELIN